MLLFHPPFSYFGPYILLYIFVSIISGAADNLTACKSQNLKLLEPHRRLGTPLGLSQEQIFKRLPTVMSVTAVSIFMPAVTELNCEPSPRIVLLLYRGRDTSIGIATCYLLDGAGIEFRCGRDILHRSRPALGSNQPSTQWVPGLSRG
jgi:hypothetical protein